MPLMIACPRKGCNHPGPMGFSEPSPWGMHVYHGAPCPGVWLYNNTWYESEAEAWKQYKLDYPGQNPNWIKAFDAKIIKRSERSFKHWIEKWKEDEERVQQAWDRRRHSQR